MKINILIKVPEDLSIIDPTWQASNAGAAWELSQILASYTSGIAPGTTAASSYKVIHCVITLDQMDDPLTYVNSLITVYGLDWTVVGLQEWDGSTIYKNVDTNILFDYLAPRWNYDEDGNPTTEQTKELNWTHLFRGMAPWE